MKAILSSAEHHFLTSLEKAKPQAGSWMVLSFAFSKDISHEVLLSDLSKIAPRLEKVKKRSYDFVDKVEQKISFLDKGFIYLFSDSDVLVLARVDNDAQQKLLQDVFEEFSEEVGRAHSYIGFLGKEFHVFQKMADQKLLSAKRFEGYEAMCDANKVSSIAVRRERKEHPCVMMVEDDRFTASYTSNILSKDYDLYLCQTGEDAVKAYIDKAPDIVFMDIHLPGIDGHEALKAIKAVDPNAFVVMLSVDTAKNSIVQATKTGAQKFLKKPFSKERLINTVKTSPFIKNLYVGSPTNVH